MKPPVIKKGFTLIEILVVASVFSIIATGIGISFYSGMRLWGRVNSAGQNTDALITFEMMAKDLRQSLNLPVIGFEGNSSEVSFPILNGNSISRVTYKFNSNENMLLRGYVYLKNIISGAEEENYIEKKILSLNGFSLSYFCYDPENKSYSWKDTWAKDRGIFSAVRIQAKFKNEEFVKVVFIPVS